MNTEFLTFAEKRFDDRVASIADGLRRMADRIEREGNTLGVLDPALAHTWAAQRILHELAWGIPNLHAEILAEIATDIAVAKADRGAQ